MRFPSCFCFAVVVSALGISSLTLILIPAIQLCEWTCRPALQGRSTAMPHLMIFVFTSDPWPSCHCRLHFLFTAIDFLFLFICRP